MNWKTLLLASSLISIQALGAHADVSQIKQLGVKYTDDNTFHFSNTDPIHSVLTETLDVERVKEKLRIDPILFLNLRREKQIINLSLQKSDGQTLEYDNHSKGYLVSRKVDGIISPMSIFKYAWSGIELLTGASNLPYIGLAPIKGYGRKEVRHMEKLEDAQDLSRLFLPTKEVEVNQMKIGESVTFRTYGGRLFGFGVGLFGMGARRASVVRGTWETSVKKVAPKSVLVSQLNINIDEDGHKIIKDYKETINSVHLGSFLDLRKTKLKQMRTSHSYIVDLSDPQAQEAYIQFVKGNSLPIERLARNTNVESVHQYKSFVEEMEAQLVRKRASIPLLFKWERTKGVFSTDGEFENHPMETTESYEYDAYVEHTYRRTAVNKQKYELMAFVGSVSNEHESLKDTELRGTFLYDYSDNKGKTRVVNRRIRDLVEFTGLKEAGYKFPSKGKIGYFNFNLMINFPTETTKYLMDLSEEKGSDKAMLALSDRVVSGYVHHMGEGEKDCQDFDRHSNKRLRELGMMELDIHEGCFERMQKRARENMQALLKSLRSMKRSLNQDDKSAFSKHYSEFGKQIVSNRFNFQTIFNLVKDKGAQLRLIYQGERISKMVKGLTWESK